MSNIKIRNGQKMHPNNQSVNVCIKCRRTNLHIDAVKAGYRKCPTCIENENNYETSKI